MYKRQVKNATFPSFLIMIDDSRSYVFLSYFN